MSELDTSVLARWLQETGIDGGEELPAVLAKRCGGNGVEGLRNVNEAELMLACGRIGFKGVRLRKLLASIKTLREGGEADMAAAPTSSSRTHDSGTGGSAFDTLVAKEGPPPPSPRSSPDAPKVTPRTEAPIFTPRSTSLPLAAPASNPTPPPPPIFTPRTTAEVRATFGDEAVVTPRKVATAKAIAEETAAVAEADAIMARELAQALDEDEAMALKLQAELDNASSEAVARMALDDAKAQKVKRGKPAKKKSSPTTAVPKLKTSAAAKGVAVTAASFSVDIGTTKLTFNVSKAMMGASLLDALVTPVIAGYLADKPACVRLPLMAHPDDVDVVLDGAVVDATSAVKAHVRPGAGLGAGLDAQPVPVMLILPQWAVDVITRAPAFLKEILIDEGEASATFHVDVFTARGGKAGFETQCTLHAEWLAKPVLEAVVTPALEAHARASPAASVTSPAASAANVTITVDSKPIDGSQPASTYVRADGMPPAVAIWLPMPHGVRNELQVDVRVG